MESFPRNRIEQKAQIEIRTDESEPQVFREEAAVRYQPLPPVITTIATEKPRSVVHEAELRFRAHIASQAPQLVPRLQVTLVQSQGSKELFRESWTSPTAADIEKSLKLEAGDNAIQLTVANAADAAADAAESASLVRTVTYSPSQRRRPRLLCRSPIAAAVTRGVEGNGEAFVVDQPVIRVQGEVSAGEPLAELSWQRDKTSPVEAVAGFKPLGGPSAKVNQEIRLEPGLQNGLVRARRRQAACGRV